MLKKVKRQAVKTIETSRGRHVSYMEPSCIQEHLPTDNTLKGQTINPRTVTWVCLPYFTLEKYSGLEGGASSGAFPVQTLLQAQFSRVARSRDMQQVVARDRQVPSGFCYHIAQLWCLVLDNCELMYPLPRSLLVTELTGSTPSRSLHMQPGVGQRPLQRHHQEVHRPNLSR
jgi:hypothetical protein